MKQPFEKVRDAHALLESGAAEADELFRLARKPASQRAPVGGRQRLEKHAQSPASRQTARMVRISRLADRSEAACMGVPRRFDGNNKPLPRAPAIAGASKDRVLRCELLVEARNLQRITQGMANGRLAAVGERD